MIVKSGEIIPVDGEADESCYVDQSALTGEPLPILLEKGKVLLSGSINAGNTFQMRASGNVAQSTYSGIITMVRNSRAESSPNVRLANQWAIRFVPFTIFMAGMAWFISGKPERAVSIFVVATPCPLILAVPIALVAGMSRATKYGAVIKGGASLEKLSRAGVVLLDKTGTVTHGGPVVAQIKTLEGINAEYALQIAASLDQYSPHVVAKSLVEAAKKMDLQLFQANEVREDHGREVTGIVENLKVRVGTPPKDLPDWAKLSQPLIVAVHIDDKLLAVIGLDDPIRKDSRETINQLRALGISEIVLMTGDREETANLVAEQLGITNVVANSTPEIKLQKVSQYKSISSGAVVVVGDGINDAPALAASDVGIAMGARGASAASEAADVVIIEDSIDRVVNAIRIARLSTRKALQASGIGMLLAIIAMFAAGLNLLTPSEGAILQEVIDLLAIFWALTTLRSKS